jgi:hypothetical protein
MATHFFNQNFGEELYLDFYTQKRSSFYVSNAFIYFFIVMKY